MSAAHAFAPRPAWWRGAAELSTERLALRAISPGDADEVGAALWANRDHLAPWIVLPSVEPTRAAVRHRMRKLAAAFAAGERLLYTLRPRAGGELLGCAGLVPSGGATCMLSYWLAAAHTRRGYAREAVAALARLAFARAGAHRVRIECLSANVRSAAVARAAGFERTGARDGVEVWTLEATDLDRVR